MANDALDPGPHGTYPYWPRNPDGSNAMPWGVIVQTDKNGNAVTTDVTPRHPDGTPIIPPDLADELGGGGA